ncbi:MAG: T9SS type A sorting domain-containing protein [Saprospiraceae bacterium]|nr:T9SS type A sorting domain-containing protein [Saprospiraceae bacterium]
MIVLMTLGILMADSLLVQNAATAGSGDPAKYQKEFNAIYLAKLAQNNLEFTPAEKEALDAIAAQCPELGGHAVFAARALRALYNGEVIEESGDCEPATQSLRTAERTNTMQMQEIKEKVHSNVWADVRIFPNPASNSFTIAYNLTQPAEMRLYDIHGKMKVSRILPAIQAGREEIPVHQLLSGVYVVVVLTESGERFTTRLSIMR